MIFAPSHRQITIEKATEITIAINRLKSHPDLVGVFVNSPPQKVNRIADICNLDWVQLSGSENWEYCFSIKRPIIKAIHISPQHTSREIIGYMREGYSLRPKEKLIYLLDTHIVGSFGGTGKTFNWQLAKEIGVEYPVMVAGGLIPHNVGQLIAEVKPWG